MELEREGLIVSMSDVRRIIQLDKQDVHHLYRLRITLEKLAVERAILNLSLVNLNALKAKLASMRNANTDGDAEAFTASDFDIPAALQGIEAHLQHSLILALSA